MPKREPDVTEPSTCPRTSSQLRLSVMGSRPPVWRRVLVPGGATLAGLSRGIDAALSLDPGRPHLFIGPLGIYSDGRGPIDKVFYTRTPEGEVRAARLLQFPCRELTYEHDYRREPVAVCVRLEQTVPTESALCHPTCMGGRGVLAKLAGHDETPAERRRFCRQTVDVALQRVLLPDETVRC